MKSDDVGGGASRTTEPAVGSSSGTDVDLREYLGVVVAALDRRSAELRAADLRFDEERDRRYTEIATEREKALKIKETADLAALSLAREIQDYKDEKANELRSQIERERGDYATQADLKGAVEKIEAALKPLADFVALQQGRQQGVGLSANAVVIVITIVLAAVAILYSGSHP